MFCEGVGQAVSPAGCPTLKGMKAVAEWLARNALSGKPSDEQARLRAAAAKALGSTKGGKKRRAEGARSAVRDRLRKRRAR
jgi:hypothetical protein